MNVCAHNPLPPSDRRLGRTLFPPICNEMVSFLSDRWMKSLFWVNISNCSSSFPPTPTLHTSPPSQVFFCEPQPCHSCIPSWDLSPSTPDECSRIRSRPILHPPPPSFPDSPGRTISRRQWLHRVVPSVWLHRPPGTTTTKTAMPTMPSVRRMAPTTTRKGAHCAQGWWEKNIQLAGEGGKVS